MRKREPIVMMILILIVVLIGIVGYKNMNNNSDNENQVECVKQQTTCCSCNMGGKDECMTIKDAELAQQRLDDECPPANELFCSAVYRCEEFECIYENGECVAK